MDTRKRRARRNENTIPCACGCGNLIYQYGTDGRLRRFDRGHQFRGNTYGAKPYNLEALLELAEPLRPDCACGCGEKLEVPAFLQRKGKGIKTIQSYWKQHPYFEKHGLWETRTQSHIAASGHLSSEVLGLIYGTLLGDAAITYPNPHSRYPRLSWTHGETQKDWLRHKAEKLPLLRPKLKEVANGGYGKISHRCNTICHPELVDVFQIVKSSGTQKRVSEEWLHRITPEGLAWWYMDDGSLSLSPQGSSQIQIHTEGFSEPENQLLAEWLTQLGYPTQCKSYLRAATGTRYYYLWMGAATSRKWVTDLQQFSCPAMEYKFGEGRICPPRWG
ncbi:hypothetical protein LEP3755_56670 [Leptolyngbya sp. NIES-3755]|nr:hypothetical protein LEP3755_56670 [Leptolyngbya sp. NIES-3755]